MKKILLVTSEFKVSGPNNVISNLINSLLKNSQYVIKLTSLRKCSEQTSSKYLNKINLNKDDIIKCNNSLSLPHLFKLIKKYSPDVINTHGFRADIFVFLLSFIFKYKHVATVHNIPNEDYVMRYGKFTGQVMLYAHMFVFRSNRVLKIAVSNNAKKNLILLGAKNVDYIYNGIDKQNFGINRKSKPLHENCNRRKKVIYCGHLSKIKDPLTLARTAPINKDIDIIFLGSGELQEAIEKFKSENIILAGRVENVASYLSNADLFVMPSISEGMPMALIEAMFAGLPIICSDIPIFKEVLSLGNANIDLFKVGDYLDLAKKIKESVNHSGEANILLAEHYFSSTAMADKYQEAFSG